MKTKKLHIAIIAFTAFNFLLLTHKAQAQACFSPATNFTVGEVPTSIISADFNNDGNPDLAVTDSFSYVLVKLGDGTGGFGSAAYFMIGHSLGSGPISVISADFNGDGNADLATANAYDASVSVLLGNGAGGFGSLTNFTVGTYPISIISADFNGDHKPDLAVANNHSNNVSVLLGDGFGGFGATNNFTVQYTPLSVICGDFNGDGKADLAFANGASGSVSILIGNGAGSFGTAAYFSVGYIPCSIISADFNGDGKADLATADSANQVSIFLGNGAGSFSTATNFGIGGIPHSIVSADFNGDGKADLATANSGTNKVSVLLGNGAGSFGWVVNFAVGSNPSSISYGDFNKDGKPDLVVTNGNSSNSVSVLLNNLFTVTATASSDTVCAGTSLTLTGDGATSYTWTGGVTNGVAFAAPTSTTTFTVTGTTTGCSYTATKTITVNPLPTATFTTKIESSSLYCDGSINAHLAGGTGTIQDQWLDSIQTVLSSTDSIVALCHGTYTLHLNDANSCTNSYTQTIQVGPIPPTPSICLVTVDSSYTHNLLIWEKTNLNMTAIDSFEVYREITTNHYQRIGAVSHNSLSIFTDLAANPASTGYRYKLKSKNTKGVTSLFSNYHNTVYLTNTGANFNWTPYQVENNTTPVSTYNVYRDDNSTGNFILIGNTTGNQFGFTDVQYTYFPNASYYVEAVIAAGACHPTRSDYAASRSNVKHVNSNGVQQLNNPSAFNIYPNPNNGVFNLEFGIQDGSAPLTSGPGIKDADLSIYNVMGEKVYSKKMPATKSLTLNLDLPKGMYFVEVSTATEKSVKKITVIR